MNFCTNLYGNPLVFKKIFTLFQSSEPGGIAIPKAMQVVRLNMLSKMSHSFIVENTKQGLYFTDDTSSPLSRIHLLIKKTSSSVKPLAEGYVLVGKNIASILFSHLLQK